MFSRVAPSFRISLVFMFLGLAGLSCAAGQSGVPSQSGAMSSPASGYIQHIFIIMQENRSFDHYFGTYPGAHGIPRDATGVPAVCAPDPLTGVCMRPYHSTSLFNHGGPHTAASAAVSRNNGKMDGFVAAAETGKQNCSNPNAPQCAGIALDAMSYHTAREIPNYWTYASRFVLQDNLYEAVASWSLPAHLFMVSGWSAFCTIIGDPMSCKSNIAGPSTGPAKQYQWTDITYLLHKNGISWKYYVEAGPEPDCISGEMECAPGIQGSMIPNMWNPLPLFRDVELDNELDHIVPFDDFFIDANTGNLPQVAWIVPNNNNSEHPANSIWPGQAYVTGVINTIMQSPDWPSTAIFVSWDDWGGFYDHTDPPKVDANGYGFRVPGLVISPYAKRGFIDHQVLSHDAYLKFIEDVFLGTQRLDPATDGRPDSRPDVRENAPVLGDLMKDFDFTQAPQPPLVLNQYYNYPCILYAADARTNNISAYSINGRTGALTPIAGSPFSTGGTNPVTVVHDPQFRFLFVANKDSDNVAAYMVNQTSGALSAVPGSPFAVGRGPVDLVVDTTGGYLFVLNSADNDLFTFTIDSLTGGLTKIATTLLATHSPTGMAMESSGRFLYVTSSFSQQIFGLVFDNSLGTLSAMSGSPFATGSSAGPLGVAIDRASRWLFSANSTANTVSQFRIGYTALSAGVLSPINSPLTVGADPTAITVFDSMRAGAGHPYIFAANRSSNSISAFSVSNAGTPTPLSKSPYSLGSVPAGIGCDEWNGYVYVATANGIWAFKVGLTNLFPVAGSPFPDANNPQAIDVLTLAPVPI